MNSSSSEGLSPADSPRDNYVAGDTLESQDEMVPTILNDVGQWLDRFADALNAWERVLRDLQHAYLNSDQVAMLTLCVDGEAIQAEIAACKAERQELLLRSEERGHPVSSVRDLAIQFDSQWPALWTQRLRQMELQLNRIHQMSMGLWVSTFHSQSLVTDLLKILATGQMSEATYGESETASLEGGYLINEAA